MPFSIYIVDDHLPGSEFLRTLVEREPDFVVVGTAASAAEAASEVPALAPDLVIARIELRDGSGIELTKQLKVLRPKQRILFVSAFDENVYAERALRAGASGYVMRSAKPETIVEAIRTVLGGERYVSRAIRDRIVERRVRGHVPNEDPLRHLSDREMEIFRLLGSGMSVQAIAEMLHISPKTVESHRTAVRNKLGLKTASDVHRQAAEWHRRQVDRGRE